MLFPTVGLWPILCRPAYSTQITILPRGVGMSLAGQWFQSYIHVTRHETAGVTLYNIANAGKSAAATIGTRLLLIDADLDLHNVAQHRQCPGAPPPV